MAFKHNYTLIEEIGAGGMATVSKAIQLSLDRVVAVKRILPKLVEKPGLIDRFEREAKASAALNHVNIMDVIDFDRDDDGGYYIVMEFIDGPTLAEMVPPSEALPLDVVLSIMIQLLSGLEHAHNNGVLHRDVKPANIMITRGGMVKITDFGVSQVRQMPSLTLAGQLFGSPAYMSPEQAHGRTLDSRSDLFSCGIILYELLTGVMPFDDENVIGVMQKIANSPYRPIVESGRTIPPELHEIIHKALEKEVTQRYYDAAEFAYALESYAFQSRIMVGPRVLKNYLEEHHGDEFEKGKSVSTSQIRNMKPTTGIKKQRPTVAVLPLQGCFGCQVNMLDLHEKLKDFDRAVDVQFSYLMDHKDVPRVDLGFVEGAVANVENEDRLRKFREKCDVLVALGTCACFGGIPGMRNLYSKEEVVDRAYLEAESLVDGGAKRPNEKLVPALTQGVKTVSDVVNVDFIIPGCPSPHDLILASIKNLVDGSDLPVPSHTLCRTCGRKHKEMLRPKREFIANEVKALMEVEQIDDSICFLEQGVLCMGIVTREGCGNRCIQNNTPCTGCMGPPPRVRETGAKWADALGSLLPGGAIRFRHDLVGLGYRYSMPISMIPTKQKGGRKNGSD